MVIIPLLMAGPADAAHDWIGLDLCRTYPERMPPELDPALMPDSGGPGAALVGRFCGQCHFAPAPGQHTAAEWQEVTKRMDLLMQVTNRFGSPARPLEIPNGEERTGLLVYLQGHALRPLAPAAPAPDAYRTLCGDCHAAPDPIAYPDADWRTLLDRMADHRRTMGRGPAEPGALGEVLDFLGLPPAAAPGQGTVAVDENRVGGRWLALGPFFALVLIGLGRWWLRHRGTA